MTLEYRKATAADAGLLIEIYNAAFYSDYLHYGECPAYGKTKEAMVQSIASYPKFLILCSGKPVGCVSCKRIDAGTYEIGCLCVVPEYQGKGIGTQAIQFITSYCADGNTFTLVTPADKAENVTFYTEKCGFAPVASELDGNVRVTRFVLRR